MLHVTLSNIQVHAISLLCHTTTSEHLHPKSLNSPQQIYLPNKIDTASLWSNAASKSYK